MLISYINADLVNDGMIKYKKGDKQEASRLFKEACDAGDTNGCYKLGMLYYYGYGVRQNKLFAKELFGEACEDGKAGACKNYKIINEEGIK